MGVHAQDQELHNSFVDRVLGILKLDRPTYERIAADPNAMTQAVGIVLAVSVANGIAQSTGDGPGIIGGMLAGVVGWAIIGAAVAWIGQRMAGPHSEIPLQRSLRLLGWAMAPTILYLLTPLPLGGLISFAASIWAFVAYVVAVQVLTKVSVGKAILILIAAAFIAGLTILIVTFAFIT